MEYIFKEGEENKPANERMIQKRGHVIEFTMLGMEHDIKTFEKTLKELRANRDLKKSIVDNVETHHPFVKDIPEFDRYVIHMYQENVALVKQFDLKIDEIQNEFNEYVEEIALVKEVLPELAEIVSPMVKLSDGTVLEGSVEEAVNEPEKNDQKGNQTEEA